MHKPRPSLIVGQRRLPMASCLMVVPNRCGARPRVAAIRATLALAKELGASFVNNELRPARNLCEDRIEGFQVRWLDQMRVEASIHRTSHILGLPISGHRDKRYALPIQVAYLHSQFVAIHPRHTDVKKRYIRYLLRQRLQSGRTIGRSELEYRLSGVIDSIAFGAAGSALDGLLVASSNLHQRPVVAGGASDVPHQSSVMTITLRGRPSFSRVPASTGSAAARASALASRSLLTDICDRYASSVRPSAKRSLVSIRVAS